MALRGVEFEISSPPVSMALSRKRVAFSSPLSGKLLSGQLHDVPSQVSSSKSAVERPAYRYSNLTRNKIKIRPSHEIMPQHVADLVSEMERPRDEKRPLTLQASNELELFERHISDEAEIEMYLNSVFFPPLADRSLYRVFRQVMGKHTVPHSSGRTDICISTPVPDLLCGYYRTEAFTRQAIQLDDLASEATTCKLNMIYPFLVVEYKGTNGSMWVATNQCAGGSVSCSNMIERLNMRLSHAPHLKVCNTSFSIAMNGAEARLYATWKEDAGFCMQKIRGFLLQDPEHYQLLHQMIDNIMDWALGVRLQAIQTALESL